MLQVERWGVFELALDGPAHGNPFVDVTLRASMSCGDRSCELDGFYDGDGAYRVRFSPDEVGEWTYRTESNVAELHGQTGAFVCVPAQASNHGPVRVANTFHFSYADGTPYYPFGTTSYAWTHQGDDLEEQTLRTLAASPFNKIRMCVFPKHYPYNRNEPVHHPFEETDAGERDFRRFDPAFFGHFEHRLRQLLELGIQADVILWHPYDRWGYATMDEDDDLRYLRYVIARMSAYRHVWWSLANEYDFMNKPMRRWDRFFEVVVGNDPHGRLRSIHNGVEMYDHHKPWVTHVCMQGSDVRQTVRLRKAYNKPIVNDELEYEGNVPNPWGCISAEEEVHRFWSMMVNGGYGGHGETYWNTDDVLWWSKGGVLHGESPDRIRFLRDVIESGPPGGLDPQVGVAGNVFDDQSVDSIYLWFKFSGASVGNDYTLVYLEDYQPVRVALWLDDATYEVDIIDPWEMTITPAVARRLTGRPHYLEDHERATDPTHDVELPGRPKLALRIRRLAV